MKVFALTPEFDPATHTYTVNGEPVMSVTQIVAPLGEDYDEPDDLTEGIIDAATERGTVMHDYIRHRLMGGAAEDYEMPDAYLDYADAVELFLAEHEVVPLCIETPMAASWEESGAVNRQLAGTPDLICELDGVTTLLDWKFVSSISKSKVGAQLAGYALLCSANGIFPEAQAAVQFLRGSYRIYPVADAFEAENAFRLCREIVRVKTRKHTRGKLY